jgi:hypothetical protein
MNNTGRLGAQAAQDAALGRVQEQLGAIDKLGMQIYSGRNSDEDTNRFNASQRNNMMQQNASNQLQFWGQQDAANMGYRPQGGSSAADQLLAMGGSMRAWHDAQRASGRV